MTIEKILQLANQFEELSKNSLVKEAFIRKLPNGKYRVLSEKGKNLGTYDSKEQAAKRLKQIEYFKHLDKNHTKDQNEVIDLTDIDEFAYSAVMRKLRQKADKEEIKQFMVIFKKEFDRAVKEKLKKPEKIALQNAMVKFNKIHKVKLSKKITKNAATSELGDSAAVGKYLAGIVSFILNRIPQEKRFQAKENLKNKFRSMNIDDISSKHLPDFAAISQSITFIKHVLFNHDHDYVKQVIDAMVNAL